MQEHVIKFPDIAVTGGRRTVCIQLLTTVDDAQHRQVIVSPENFHKEPYRQFRFGKVCLPLPLADKGQQPAVQVQSEMPLVAEHRHAVERVVFEQPAVEPVPVFRHADFGTVFRLGSHDTPDMGIVQQAGHGFQAAGLFGLVDKTDDSLRRMLQDSGQIPLFLIPAENR